MSIRDFADHIGVSHRMVSKWEARGESIELRPGNQASLDTAFATASTEVKEDFLARLRTVTRPSSDLILPPPHPQGAVRHPIDQKLMALVDEGIFLSGPDNQPVWLAAYYIDVYPTTNADYGQFIAATDHRAPQHWKNGKFDDDLASHPVVFVTWNDAAAYADWAGKRLPSSLQWEKAARGNAGNVYPWGRQATFAKCNVREAGNGATTPIDCYQSGASPYGIYDMCGNTWEWCATPSGKDRYQLKGSAFTSPFERCTPSRFNDADVDMHDDDTGFRCVAPIEA